MFLDVRVGRNFCRLSVERCVLICHGLPYEPGSAIQKSYYELAKRISLRIPAIAFDFSGTGLSEGNFGLLEWKEDVERLAAEFGRVILLGYSMGGAVAVAAAAELDNVEKLVTVSSPCCLDMFGEDALRAIYYNAKSKSLLRGIGDYENFREKFLSDFLEIEPVRWIAEVRVPKLIVHGLNDEIVPFEHAERLFARARKPKSLMVVRDGDHFLRRRSVVTDKIVEWIEGKIREEKITI
ncbi:MAG: alpha/beta hydrolase [Archaeoglobaceae archaeon]